MRMMMMMRMTTMKIMHHHLRNLAHRRIIHYSMLIKVSVIYTHVLKLKKVYVTVCVVLVHLLHSCCLSWYAVPM